MSRGGRAPQHGQQIARPSRGIVLRFGSGGQQILHQDRRFFNGLREDRPVHGHHHGMGGVLAYQTIERPDALLRSEPAPAQRRALAVYALALLRRLSDLRPGAPGDGLACETQRPAMAGKLIQEGIGGGVVGLAGIAHHAHTAREQYEHVQIAVHRRSMQMPGAQHLRPKHLLEALPALVGERAVRQHAHAVDHARKGRQFVIHAGQHPIDRRRIGNIRQFHFHPHAAVPERADGLLGGFVGRAPSVQHDRPRAPFG